MKLNHLDIYNYSEYILTQIQNSAEDPDYESLLPYLKELPESLRV